MSKYEYAELSISNNMHFLHPHQVVVLKYSQDEYPLALSFRHFNVPKYKSLEEGRKAALDLCNELNVEIKKDVKSMPNWYDKCSCVFCRPPIKKRRSRSPIKKSGLTNNEKREMLTNNEKREMLKNINLFKLIPIYKSVINNMSL
jgi:hypothetical protein